MWHKPNLLNWIANFLYAIAVVLMLYSILFIVIRLPIFPFKEVKVHGEVDRINHAQVQLIVNKHLKGNFFTLNLNKTRAAFEKLPWVQTVSVKRRWPDRLEINVTQHKALARWGDLGLVNMHGELFQAATDANLPVFSGPEGSVAEVTEHYKQFSEVLKKNTIDIAKVTLSPRRAWQIETDKGMRIALGREHVEKRLDRFSRAYQNTLATLNVDIQYADLRYSNGFAVRKPGKAIKKSLEKSKGKA